MTLLRLSLASLAIAATLGGTASPAAAQERTTQYALVVGANVGGAGQEVLQFAERDSESFAATLRTVGRVPAHNITRLSQPTPQRLERAIETLGRKLAAHEARGEKTTLVFFYSGHARAASLNLGNSELDLPSLRKKLEALPATLKVVILDACQSGSFSRIKGVAGAADFSINSVSNLNASGMAVMASSSATELSQESERLGGSYFTHYLIVALRGAGDDNRDGRVTLDEAYRYAYNRTLAATARTAVGKQHVTLETDLRGKGEIALSFPTTVKTALVFDKTQVGEFLVQQKKSGAVIAELNKVKDKAVRLALAPGDYRILVRRGDRARECNQRVAPGRSTPFSSGNCRDVVLESTLSKGYQYRRPWAIEFSHGLGYGRGDAFTDRLNDFGFEGDPDDVDVHLDIGLVRHMTTGFWMGVSAMTLSSGDFRRSGDTELEDYTWWSGALVGTMRYERPLLYWPSGNPAVAPFVDLGIGLTRSSTSFQVGDRDPDNETEYGYLLSAAAGGQVMFLPAFGIFAKARYAVAPTIDNLLGDTHDVGGTYFSIGVRGTLSGGF